MSLPQFFSTFLSGVVIGLTVAAPVGPMGILCIQRTLTCGAATGLATGIGAATVHLAYSALAVLGLATLAKPWIEAHSLFLGILSGLTLFWFAMRMRRSSMSVHGSGPPGQVPLINAYVSAIGLGFANPLTVVLFLAALHTFSGKAAAPSLVAGVFVGSALWWTLLSTAMAVVRSRFDAGGLALSGKCASLILMTLGTVALLKALAELLH